MCPTGTVGCVCAHLAFILFVIAMGGRSWNIAYNDGHGVNVTESLTSEIQEVFQFKATNHSCHKGLWVGNCGKTDFLVIGNFTQKEPDFYLTQCFYGFAFLMVFMSLLITYLVLCCSCCKTCEIPFCCFAFVPCLQALSAITGVVALIINGVSYKESSTFPPNYNKLYLGWTYWVAVASVIMVALSALLSGIATNDEKKEQRQYEKI